MAAQVVATTLIVSEDSAIQFKVPLNCTSSVDNFWSISLGTSSGNIYTGPELSLPPLELNSEASESGETTFEYRPNEHFFGVDFVQFGDTLASHCKVKFIVLPSPDVPVVKDDFLSARNLGKPISLNPLFNDGMDDAISAQYEICFDDFLFGNSESTRRGGPLFFVDVAAELGIDVLQQEAGRFKDGSCAHEDCTNGYCQPTCDATYMYGGAAVGDINGDGHDDLIVARLDQTPKVFLNYGDGTFQDVTVSCGIGATDDAKDTVAVAVGDIDNDGDLDIYFTTYGKYHYGRLYINDGTGHFTEESLARGVDNSHTLSKSAAMGATFGDFDNDGFLDLVTGEWMHQSSRTGNSAQSEGFKIFRNIGHKRNGCEKTHSNSNSSNCGGYFDDITDELSLPVSFTDAEHRARRSGDPTGTQVFGCMIQDYDGDNWDDLWCVTDFGNTKIFLNDGNGSFVDDAYAPPNHSFDQEFGPYSLSQSSSYRSGRGVVDAMGSTIGDINEDGRIDVFVTAISCPGCNEKNGKLFYGQEKSGNRLYLKKEGFDFDDKTIEFGVSDGGWAWGTSMFDFDNDGDLDIALVNGFDFPGSTEDLLATESKLFENVLSCTSGRPENQCKNSDDVLRMVENGESLGFSADKSKGRGLLTFDYDSDGDLDIFVVNNEGRAEFFENRRGNSMDWLKVKVVDRTSGSDCLGAMVYLQERPDDDPRGSSANEQAESTKWKVRRMGATSFYLGTGETTVHFGLGDPTTTPLNAVKIFWPKSNNTLIVLNVKRNTQLRVKSMEGFNRYESLHHVETIPQCPHLAITEVTQPVEGGTVGIDITKKHLNFFPSRHFNGSISFTYQIVDLASIDPNNQLENSGTIVLDVLYEEGSVDEAFESIYPPLNGVGNNEEVTNMGCPFMSLGRVAPSEYDQSPHAHLGAFDTPVTEGEDAGENARPSPREISNVLFAQTDNEVPSLLHLNDLHVHMGQMIVHDTDFSTPFANGDLDDMMGIKVPTGDFTFDENNEGGRHIRFRRSGVAESTGNGFNVNREQFNKVTSFLDLSQVYSPSMARLLSMRSLRGGKLVINPVTGLLPENKPLMQLANPLEKDLETQLLSGDNRANVHPALLALHTLFHLEHNKLADEVLEEIGVAANDEVVFQKARVKLMAKYQAIVYEEWLPALLGPNMKLSEYTGYDPTVTVQIKNEFATAAARFGHSQVNELQFCLEADGSECEYGHLLLRDSYFKPGSFNGYGISRLFKGMFGQPAQEIDTKIVNGLRNFLFGTNAAPLDLASINIQRGRDHGIADFNSVRAALGLARYSKFEEISPSNPALAEKMKLLYSDRIENVDLFVGGLAEDHLKEGNLGETFARIIKDQFEVLRDGDRFYYENVDLNFFSPGEISRIKKSGLCSILNRHAFIDGYGVEACGSANKPFLFIPENESWWNKWNADDLPIITAVVSTLFGTLFGLWALARSDKIVIAVKKSEGGGADKGGEGGEVITQKVTTLSFKEDSTAL